MIYELYQLVRGIFHQIFFDKTCNLTTPKKKLVMIPDMDHDLDDLGVYMGPGLTKPLAHNASCVMGEIAAWLGSDHA
jgi:hypothetical protein